MKYYLKIYTVSIGVFILCIIFPWVLKWTDIAYSLASVAMWMLVGGIASCIFNWLYFSRKIQSIKIRLLLFFLQPSLYYVVAIILLGYLLDKQWDAQYQMK